jgi:hypothetical protein
MKFCRGDDTLARDADASGAQLERDLNDTCTTTAPIRISDEADTHLPCGKVNPAIESSPNLRVLWNLQLCGSPDRAEVNTSRAVHAEPEVLLDNLLPIAIVLETQDGFVAKLHQEGRLNHALVFLIMPDLSILVRLCTDQYRFPSRKWFFIEEVKNIVD